MVLRQRNVGELPGNGGEVRVFLVGLPAPAGLSQQAGEVKRRVLVGRTNRSEGLIIVQHAEVGAGFRPKIAGLRGMDMWIISARRGQDVMVSRRIRDLLADVLYRVADVCKRGPIDEAIDERRIGILIDLLDFPR